MARYTIDSLENFGFPSKEIREIRILVIFEQDLPNFNDLNVGDIVLVRADNISIMRGTVVAIKEKEIKGKAGYYSNCKVKYAIIHFYAEEMIC